MKKQRKHKERNEPAIFQNEKRGLDDHTLLQDTQLNNVIRDT